MAPWLYLDLVDQNLWLHIEVSDTGDIAGAMRLVRYAITNAATQDSASDIPANSVIVQATVKVTTAYSGGATITIGKAGGTADLLQGTGDNRPQRTGTYILDQDTDWGAGDAAVRATVGGAPAAGAGVVLVEHSIPQG